MQLLRRLEAVTTTKRLRLEATTTKKTAHQNMAYGSNNVSLRQRISQLLQLWPF